MRTISITAYEFEELSDDAQRKVLRDMQDINVGDVWWDSTYEDAKNIGLNITEFDLDRASYVHGKFLCGAEIVANNIIADRGETCETVKTAKDYLVTLQAEKDKVLAEFANKECPEDFLEDFLNTDEIDEEFLRSLCEDYRIMLQKEYEYLCYDESIKETIKANEYEFTENGKLI